MFAGSEQSDWQLRLLLVKATKTERTTKGNRLYPPAILSPFTGFSLQVRTAVFLVRRQSGVSYRHISDLLTDMPVRLAKRNKPLLRRSVVLFGIKWQCMRLAMKHRFFGFSGKGVKIAKAYLQKKGTTTEKCASSAESLQSVALLSAVIPQTVGR